MPSRNTRVLSPGCFFLTPPAREYSELVWLLNRMIAGNPGLGTHGYGGVYLATERDTNARAPAKNGVPFRNEMKDVSV
jgi:hypothetical protein